jgi:hypothetical protein
VLRKHRKRIDESGRATGKERDMGLQWKGMSWSKWNGEQNAAPFERTPGQGAVVDRFRPVRTSGNVARQVGRNDRAQRCELLGR